MQQIQNGDFQGAAQLREQALRQYPKDM